jgi:hypothetical protein
MESSGNIKNLTRQLYPRGQVFNIPDGSKLSGLHDALGISELNAVNDANSVLKTLLPDNLDFTTNDAARWEQLLDLSSQGLTLEQRKTQILAAIAHPGVILERSSADYIQGRLNELGFALFVYENLEGNSEEQTLGAANGIGAMGEDHSQMGEIEMGNVREFFEDKFTESEMGEIEMGLPEMGSYAYDDKVVNFLEHELDAPFVIHDYRNTFFVGGSTIGSFANIAASDREIIRNLLLKIKKVNSIAILFINYT